jgi:signal transduction histidine kinase
MSESYLDDEAEGDDRDSALARELLARLLPGVDTDLLVTALLAERAAGAVAAARGEMHVNPDARAEDPPMRELRRVRRQFARGDAVGAVHHDLNNPLTALLAEAQLLELEPLGDESRAAAARLVELTRRVVAAARRLDVSGASRPG